MTRSSDSNIDSERLAPLGRMLLSAGIVLLVLRGLTLTTRMPGLPSGWYSNQAMWIALGIGLSALGWHILWNLRPSKSAQWRPSLPGRRFRTATIYVGEGCHLCEEAASVLTAYREWLPIVEQIDIRTDQELVDQFGRCIPVIVLDGKIRFRGKIHEELLRRLIEGTPPIRMLPIPAQSNPTMIGGSRKYENTKLRIRESDG